MNQVAQRVSRWRTLASLVCAIALTLVPACDSGGGAEKICPPNKTETCPCGGGFEGVQSCLADGTGYTQCDCSGAASPTGDDQACTPGQSVTCACPGGGEGSQACEADGESYGACDCSGANHGGGGDTGGGGGDTGGGDDTGGACAPNYYKDCDGPAIHWYDSCGEKGAFYDTCALGTVCSAGECLEDCSPKAYTDCDGGDLFYYNSCGIKESLAEHCDATEYCFNASCVKGVYNGDWHVTEDPDKPPGGGLGGTFVANTFTLSASGDTVTMTEPVLGNTATYTGTLQGKTLVATGSFSAGGADHAIQIQVTFAADEDEAAVPPPHRFTGVYIDTPSAAGFELGSFPYNVVGVKQ